MAEAISAQWAEVGVRAEIKVSEYAEFNANWSNPDAPALKMSTWSPLYDPHTLLSLVFAGDGSLSRYDNSEANRLIGAAALETDTQAREELYRQLETLMHDDAPAVFLWNLVASYGVGQDALGWTPRGDEYVLPLSR